MDWEKKQHNASKAQLNKRMRKDVESEDGATELLRVAEYLNDKIVSREETVKELAGGEEVKIVLKGYDEQLEELQQK